MASVLEPASSLEIAQAASLRPIEEVAADLGLDEGRARALRPLQGQGVARCDRAPARGLRQARRGHGNHADAGLALRLADYVVTESGFGADTGFEKHIDIVRREGGIRPSAVVLVATVRSLRHHGDGDLRRGAANLALPFVASDRGLHRLGPSVSRSAAMRIGRSAQPVRENY